MDDYLNSTSTEREAEKIISQVIKINQAGGFEMHSWASNSTAALRNIPRNKCAQGRINLHDLKMLGEYEKVLGLNWTLSNLN